MKLAALSIVLLAGAAAAYDAQLCACDYPMTSEIYHVCTRFCDLQTAWEVDQPAEVEDQGLELDAPLQEFAAMNGRIATLSYYGGGQAASGLYTSQFHGPVWAAAVHSKDWRAFRGKILEVWDPSNPRIRTEVAIIDYCATGNPICTTNANRNGGFLIDIVRNGIGALGLTERQGVKRVAFADTGRSVLNQFKWNHNN